MNNLLAAQMTANVDLLYAKRALPLRATNWNYELNHYDMQTIITFSLDNNNYRLVLPLGSTKSQIDYYIKDQLPELLV